MIRILVFIPRRRSLTPHCDREQPHEINSYYGFELLLGFFLFICTFLSSRLFFPSFSLRLAMKKKSENFWWIPQKLWQLASRKTWIFLMGNAIYLLLRSYRPKIKSTVHTKRRLPKKKKRWSIFFPNDMT